VLFRNASGILLRHDATTNPAAAGVLMSECCCHDDEAYARCQWAVDWQFVCVGACNTGVWLDGHIGAGCFILPWTPRTVYGVGSIRSVGGQRWGCRTAHVGRDTWDALEEANWSTASFWAISSGPRCVSYLPGVPAVQPGLYYTAGNRCSATRFGAISVGGGCGTPSCPASNVSLVAPVDYDKDDRCGPWLHAVYQSACSSCDFCAGADPLPCRLVLTVAGVTQAGFTGWNGTHDADWGETPDWPAHHGWVARTGYSDQWVWYTIWNNWWLKMKAHGIAGYVSFEFPGGVPCSPEQTSGQAYYYSDPYSDIRTAIPGVATVTRL
jgi:hypothetical protein